MFHLFHVWNFLTLEANGGPWLPPARLELRLLPYSVPFDPEDVPDPLGPLGTMGWGAQGAQGPPFDG